MRQYPKSKLSQRSTLAPIFSKRMVQSKAIILASSYTEIHRTQCIDTLFLCVLEAQSSMQTDPGVSLCYIVLNTRHSVDSMLQMLISQQDVEVSYKQRTVGIGTWKCRWQIGCLLRDTSSSSVSSSELS